MDTVQLGITGINVSKLCFGSGTKCRCGRADHSIEMFSIKQMLSFDSIKSYFYFTVCCIQLTSSALQQSRGMTQRLIVNRGEDTWPHRHPEKITPISGTTLRGSECYSDAPYWTKFPRT